MICCDWFCHVLVIAFLHICCNTVVACEKYARCVYVQASIICLVPSLVPVTLATQTRQLIEVSRLPVVNFCTSGLLPVVLLLLIAEVKRHY